MYAFPVPDRTLRFGMHIVAGADIRMIKAPLELGILRNFEFVSELRRASVIVRQFGDNGASIFVKGAPESVRAICLPDSRQYIQWGTSIRHGTNIQSNYNSASRL